MKALLLVFFCVLLAGCGSVKSTTNATSTDDNKLILPPDTPSNKYSKTRQANKN
jgi:uncharacterized protein YceK